MPKKQPHNLDQDPLTQPINLTKLKAKTESQKQYVDGINDGKIVIASGPAGTGKTYICTRLAVEKLLNGTVKKIVITRPVVEAGEKLGFLPGTLEEKINPYLRPIMDALEDHLGDPALVETYLQTGVIEIAPLAYMRGRTFNDCFVILDEAENTTIEQIKMFVTRYGYGSTFVINGDPGQSDLPKHGGEHGLSWLYRKLQGDEDVIKILFEKKDIVRHPLIATMLTQLEAPDTEDK